MTEKDTFSNEVLDTLNDLDRDLTFTFDEWNLFTGLFGHSEKRIDILNSSSPHLFHDLQRILQDAVYLRIARLLDPASMKGSKNLTLSYLQQLVKRSGHIALADELNDGINKLRREAQQVLWYRHKRLAHRDLDASKEASYIRLSRADISSILVGISDLLNKVHLANDNSSFYHRIGTTRDSASSLTYWIAQGLRSNQIRHNVLRGKTSSDDLVKFFIHEHPTIDH
ncbi:MAG: hypothetical protein AAF328_06660 [Planctomycetota bacterium]